MKQRPPTELQIGFDRVTYRDGQLLAARDQQDDFHANDRMRRMHTRFLHDTWGIGLGFTVGAKVGDDSVHVGPGYAVDSSAREILLAADIALSVPNTPEPTILMLVIGYLPGSAYQGLPDVATLCAGTSLDPRGEKPLFNWRTPDTLDLSVDVPLAGLHVQTGALTQQPDLSVRRYAARMVRPHIASGIFEYKPRRQDVPTGINVDTSDAGFANTPQYFVRLDAPGLLDIGVQFFANSSYIDSATSKQFTYVIPGLLFLVELFEKQKIALLISWLGVEPVAGCEPVANQFLALTPGGFLKHGRSFSERRGKEEVIP